MFGRYDNAHNSADGGGLPAVPQNPPWSVARMLRTAREEADLRVQDVATAIRVRATQLRAIEDGRYHELPGAVYATGFVRAYADYLGLDVETVSRRFKEEIAGLERQTELVFPTPVPEGRVPGGAILMVALLLAVGAYGGWLYLESTDRRLADLAPALPERLAVLLGDDMGQPQGDDVQPMSAAGDRQSEASVTTPADDGPAATEPAAAEPATTEPAATEPTATEPAATEPTIAQPVAADPVVTEPTIGVELSGEPAGAPERADLADLADLGGQADPVAVADLDETIDASDVAEFGPPMANAAERLSTDDTASDQAGRAATAILGEGDPSDVAVPVPPIPAENLSPATPLLTAETPDRIEPPTPVLPAEPSGVAAVPGFDEPPAPVLPVDDASPTAQASGPVLEDSAAANEPAGPDETQVAAVPPPPPPATVSADSTRQYGLVNGESRILIRATEDSWVQVNHSDGSLIMTRVLRPGDTYQVPADEGLELVTGNAGGLEILVDGDLTPSLGATGAVVRDILLDADRLRDGTAVPN